jgi:hypothetical protein
MTRGKQVYPVVALMFLTVLLAASLPPVVAISHDNFETFEKLLKLLEEEGIVDDRTARRALEKHFAPATSPSNFYGAPSSDHSHVALYGLSYAHDAIHSDKSSTADKSSQYYGVNNVHSILSFTDSEPPFRPGVDSSEDSVEASATGDSINSVTTSFYGFYGSSSSSSGFYGSSVADSDYNSLLDAYPDLEKVSDPRLRAILKRLRDGSSEHQHKDAKSSEFYGHTVSFYGYAPATSRDSESSSSSSAYRGANKAPSKSHNTLSVSFTLAIAGDYATPESKSLLASEINRSLQDATSRLGISRHLTGVTITPVTDVSPTTVSMDVEILFSDNTNGIYQFAQMLRENAIYVFPLSEYAGAQVSSVRVAAASAGQPPTGVVPGGPYAGQIGQDNQSDRASKGIKEEDAPGGCALDRFSLNGSPSCCYHPFQLDAKYECCKEASGVDECGVCGGSNQTCALRFAARVSAPASAQLSDVTSSAYNAVIQKYQQGIALLFSEYGVTAADVEVVTEAVSVQSATSHRQLLSTADYVEDSTRGRELQTIAVQTVDIATVVEPRAGLTLPSLTTTLRLLQQAADQKARYEDLQFLAVLEARRAGVCYNGFCEVGEMSDPLQPSSGEGTCPRDCPVTLQCPMPIRPLVGVPMTPCAGRGTCDETTGQCACDSGYRGEACSQCEEGFLLSTAGECKSACPHTPEISSLIAGDPLAPCGNRGTCDASKRSCECDEGYTGSDCGRCMPGFFASNGVCLLGVAAATDAAWAASSSTGTPVSSAVVVGISVAIAALLGIAMLGFLIYKRRQRSGGNYEGHPAGGGGDEFTNLSHQIGVLSDIPLKSPTSRAQTVDCHADPEPPTRQTPSQDGRRITYPLPSADMTSV